MADGRPLIRAKSAGRGSCAPAIISATNPMASRASGLSAQAHHRHGTRTRIMLRSSRRERAGTRRDQERGHHRADQRGEMRRPTLPLLHHQPGHGQRHQPHPAQPVGQQHVGQQASAPVGRSGSLRPVDLMTDSDTSTSRDARTTTLTAENFNG